MDITMSTSKHISTFVPRCRAGRMRMASGPPAEITIATAFAAQVSGATNPIYCPANRIYFLCGT